LTCQIRPCEQIADHWTADELVSPMRGGGGRLLFSSWPFAIV